MPDITTVWNVQTGEGDWAMVPGDLQGGGDLGTSVLISLFTDRLADASDALPDGSADRRGWWGDAGQDFLIGSRLWLLARAEQTTRTLSNAQGYCTEALQWLIADGVAASVNVTCSWIAPGMMGIQIELYDQVGTVIATYQWAWKGLT